MKGRFTNWLKSIGDRIRPLLILLFGGLLIYGVIRALEYTFANIDLAYQSALIWDSLDTAVNIVGIFFILIWGLFTLDHTFKKSNLKQKYGLASKSKLQVSRFFTSPFVHGNEAHVRNNLPHLLLFVGVATLMVPSAQAFLVATIIILIVEGTGVWAYGSQGKHLGASGLVLGFYTFIVGYGWLMWQFWITAVALIIAITFLKPAYYTLKNRNGQISVAGHIFGFLGGFISAYTIFWLT